MKICIVGAGAIGGLFAGWLGSRIPAGDIELSALARADTLAALKRDGLQLESASESVRVAMRASSDPAELGTQDLVIVAVKGPALAAVAPAVKQLLHPHSTVLVAMNGVPWWFFDGLGGVCEGLHLNSVDPGDVLRSAIPLKHVIGCVVHASSTVTAPARVRHVMGDGLIIGEPAGGVSARVEKLAALLTRAGFAMTASERIQRDIWFKLWGNMTMNPVSALTGATADRVLDDPLVRDYCSAVMVEAREIGGRIGLPIDQTPEQRHAVTRKLGAFKTSMLQDLEAGRPLEIDALVGAVREIGQHLKMVTPSIDSLLGLVRLMAHVRGVKDVVVLESERVGFGASGRNGGFVFGGYSLDGADLLAQLGPSQARDLYARTRQAVDTIRRRIARHSIDCDAVEGGALLANWFDDESILRMQQRLMHDHFGVDWRFIDKAGLSQWVRSDRYTAGLLEPDAFHFHPLKFALGEAAAIESSGGRVFERSRVRGIETKKADTVVTTSGGRVVARHVVIAGGGYLSQLAPALERAIVPIATYVMTTEPLGDALEALIPSRAAIYDTRFAFDYYRRLDDTRLLWGGRISIRDRRPDDIARFLKDDMVRVFPSLKDARIDHAWGGMMSYARHKMPQVGRLPDGLWYGLGFGGHGVAPTTAIGELLAGAIAFQEPLPAAFERYGLARTFRPAGLLAAQATYSWLQWKDARRERRDVAKRRPGTAAGFGPG